MPMSPLLKFHLALAMAATASPLAKLDVLQMDENTTEKIDGAVERIPNGANLRKVTLPAYDANFQPTSLVIADLIIKKSDNELDARGLQVLFFQPDAMIGGEVKLKTARFFLKEQRLEADKALTLSSAGHGIVTTGQGGVFKLNTRRGFIRGPVFTSLDQSRESTPTTMNARSLPLFVALPLLAQSPQILFAAQPAPLTMEEKIDFERAVSRSYVPNSSGKILWDKADATSANIETSMIGFLTEVGLQKLLLQADAPAAAPDQKSPTAPEKEAAPKPLISQEELTKMLTPSENRFTIRADKGAYFDGTEGHLVYLGNVTLKGRGITMTCHRELKAVFNQPKPKKAEPAKEGGKKDALFGDFQGIGDLKEIIISGQIEVIGKNKDGQPMGGRAEHAVYNAAADRLIMRGGTLVFRNGNTLAFSNDPKAYVTIRLREQTAQLEGDWRAGLPTKELQKDH